MKRCFGCRVDFRPNGIYPVPPNDLVIVSQMLRSYRKEGVEQNGKVMPVYFHVNEKCVQICDSEFKPNLLNLEQSTKEKLELAHKKFLKQVKK